MIEFRGVNKWFGPLHVLNDINLEIKYGEVVVVCGPSGSGKSTLIRCINKLEPIQGGEILDASSKGWPSPGLWLCSRRSCSSMNLLPPWTRR